MMHHCSRVGTEEWMHVLSLSLRHTQHSQTDMKLKYIQIRLTIINVTSLIKQKSTLKWDQHFDLTENKNMTGKKYFLF